MGLDTVELILDIEKRFSIEISDAEAEKIETIGDLRDCVCRHLSARGEAPNPHRILVAVKEVVSDVSGIPPHRITAESGIVDDLKIN